MGTTQFNAVDDVAGRLQFIVHLFTKDVNAMSNEVLSESCGGVSRCGHDFLFEVTGMLNHFADLLDAGTGNISGPSVGYPVAPEEAKHKEEALAEFELAKDKFVDSLKKKEAQYADTIFESPLGPMSPLNLANLAILNLTYHSGQLNYIQTIHGDAELHWF